MKRYSPITWIFLIAGTISLFVAFISVLKGEALKLPFLFIGISQISLAVMVEAAARARKGPK